MPALYYRLLLAFAASVSLLLNACGGVGAIPSDATRVDLPQPKQEASAGPEEIDTETTIWNLIGVAKKVPPMGPETGPGVSPVVWQAMLDTLNFVEMDSVDPVAGLAVTKWYSPKGKPNERFRITAFVKSRALRSDSIVVSVERQTQKAPGQWEDGPIEADVASNLENDILERARQIHIARLRALQ